MLLKRVLALALVLAMLLGLAACTQTPQNAQLPEQEAQLQQNVDQELNRQDKELIAELIGGQDDAQDLTDAELDGLIDQLIGEVGEDAASNVINLSGKEENQSGQMKDPVDPDAYDENGAMTKPFDQVYPDMIEKEQVTFSGESILIKMRSDKLTDGLKAAGVGALEKIVPLEGCAWYEAKLVEGTDTQQALTAVRQLSEVMLAEFNYEVQTAALDDYKHYDKEQEEDFKKNGHNKDQWHFHYCGIPDGYQEMETEGGDKGVIVAVIDSGVDYTHEDLKDNMWVNTKEIPDNGKDDDGNGYVDDYYGVDIIDKKGNGDDTNGHGTHVAGIIAARNNNVGVMGIAYNVKIMSVKAAAHNGTLNQADIAKAVLYAYEMGAEVINMSFGGSASSIAVQDALQTAYNRCVLVASAGNNGENNEPTAQDPIYLPNYPAALTYVLGVMSVDENGVESSFTNYDTKAFNNVEYELYAPGENIMSTLPGNQYGYLSGTSMAAPMVSAFAAILRSEFADRDLYPTKFIYGQLTCTSGIQADCLNPSAHGKHNVPQVVDLNAALTKLPRPEVNLQDWAIFDDPKYSANNNGDGVIDAGETIALGLTVRNRWGMSKNTRVTIDTLSKAGLSDPYLTIKTGTVDFGSVGTYSTQDNGKIYTDELLTGWENPFLIEVSKDCPNDYRFTLNVTITCENALDETDSTVYTTTGAVSDAVRSGYVLPSIIEEDMVLTKDNLYIIPNATIIQTGVTVRVEPGTHIQFWSNDPKDPYASSYIAYLLVKGNFLVEGTKEEPVYIYPSQLMDKYCVEFGADSNGYISLKYADITNFAVIDSTSGNHTGTNNKVNLADHCIFRQNYADRIHYRYLSSGNVKSGYDKYKLGNVNARDCVYYKIVSSSDISHFSTAQRCIFVECGIKYSGTYQDCVFLKNNNVTDNGYQRNSSYATYTTPSIPNADDVRIFYREETGTTYIAIEESSINAKLLSELGGAYLVTETEDEYRWVVENITEVISGTNSYDIPRYRFRVGIKYNYDLGQYTWNDGTPILDQADPDGVRYDSIRYNTVYLNRDGYLTVTWSTSSGYGYYVYEIPGKVLPDEITFADYVLTMDMEATCQLSPISAPVQLGLDSFLYESTDESVITVSENGLVTPVGLGTADVWVYSEDRAVKNHVTVMVKDYVPLENINFVQNKAELAVGESMVATIEYAPADTTRRNATYISGDDNIVTVDKTGVITAVGSGTTTVTATCEGIVATMEVTAYVKTTKLEMRSIALSVALADGKAELPEIVTNQGAEPKLTWRSTDERVAVIENGKLIPKALGTTSIVACDTRTGFTAACLVIVSETAVAKVKDMELDTTQHYVLLENGDLYYWSNSIVVPKCVARGVQLFDNCPNNIGKCVVLLEDGTIQRIYAPTGAIEQIITDFKSMKILDIEYSQVPGEDNAHSYFVLTDTGCVYALGYNYNGALGVGTLENVDTPTLINLEGVVDVNATYKAMYLLTSTGELYGAGDMGLIESSSPTLLTSGVKQLCWVSEYRCAYITNNGAWCCFDGNSSTNRILSSNAGIDLSNSDKAAVSSNSGGICIENGAVYVFDWNTQKTLIPGIMNAVSVYTIGKTHYIVTEDGLLLGFGSNSASYNHMAGITTENPVSTPVVIPMMPTVEETVSVKAYEQIDNSLVVSFDKALGTVAPKLYADGLQVTIQYAVTDYNSLIVSRSSGFSEGVHYELVFEAGSIRCVSGVTNAEEIRIAFTYEAGKENQPEQDGTVPEQQKVVYESQTDDSIVRFVTPELLVERLNAVQTKLQYQPYFYGNAILNHISTDTTVTNWLRPLATSVSAGTYKEIPFGGNYWGSTNQTAIELQMTDYTDFITYARLMYAPYLTEAPENTFPFVTSVKLINKYGEEVTTVGNEEITFQVKFNRDMDTSIPLQVRFGSAVPYGDYQIDGKYVDARTWEGVYTLKTVIENGDQYFSISNGCSATDDLELQPDAGRFRFAIDTTAAQALIMQGTATDTGIELRWTQDDFKTLMGYNVYRSTKEDGQYTRLNKTVIPADTMSWFDNTVEPGVVYYYNFTVVQTDLTESEPSGKIALMSKDTMAPDIYHSPVVNAFTGSNLVLSATITDNLNIAYANLYYRTVGAENWSIIRMNKLNDKYSAIIPASYITVAGVEYYIEAFDGVSYTYKGSAETPYTIAVQEALDADALGDVDGDGVITNLDALLLLYAINDKYNLKPEEFARADLNGDGELWAAEALRILQYVSGAVGSVKM